MIDINIARFLNFINTYFSLLFFKSNSLEDTKRKKPKIHTKYIFNSLLFCISTGIRSLLSLDKFLKKSFKYSSRKFKLLVLLSDSLIQKVLKTINKFQLQNIHRHVLDVLLELGYFKDPLTGLRIGIVDGTVFLKKFGTSCFLILGKSPIFFDWQRYDAPGGELKASKELLKRVLDNVKLDVVLFDGLYYCREILTICVEKGVHFLIRTKEKTLNIIKEAEDLFRYCGGGNILTKEGYDEERMLSYKIVGCGGFEYEGIKNIYVYKVHFEVSKKTRRKEEVEDFYVITTISNINLIKELALKRWAIENDLFKALKQRHNLGKSLYVRDEEAFERFICIAAVSYNLVCAYTTYELEDGEDEEKLTGCEVIRRLYESITGVLYFKWLEDLIVELEKMDLLT